MSDEFDTETVDASAPVDTGSDIAPVDPAALQSEGIDAAINAALEGKDFSRDELGRFSAKQQQDAADAAAKQAAVDPQSQPITTTAPAAWGKEKAALFASLPPDAQAYINQREQEVSDGFKRYEGLGEYASIAEQNGKNLRGVLDTVKQLEDLMEADPVRGAITIFQRAGVDPAQIARAILGGSTQQQSAQHADPAAIPPQVMQTIESLQREIQTIRQEPYEREVQTFASDPANKHFAALSPLIAQLIHGTPGITLKDAYDRAAWADPQVRAELLAEQQKTAAAERNDQLAKTAQRASQASRGLAPSTSASPLNGVRRFKTVDEAIEAAVAAHS